MTNRPNDQTTNTPCLRAVVFDLDGTLLNCPYDFAEMRRVVMEIAVEAGVQPEALAGLGILEAIVEGERLLGGDAGNAFAGRANAEVLRIELLGSEQSVALPGAQETLRWLHMRGLRTAIITRNSAVVVDSLLRHVEFQYDELLTREAVIRVKPHPEHLQTALARLGCAPWEALMVGDHIWDIACGNAVGVSSVGVATGASAREKLTEAGAVAVLASVADLPAWLEECYQMSCASEA